MITVTQFSAVVLKTAKQHLSKKAPRQQPATEASPTAEPEAVTEAPAPEEATPPVETDGSVEAQASPEEAPTVEANGSAEAQASPKQAPPDEADAAPGDGPVQDDAVDATAAAGAAADIAMLVEQMGVKEDRAARLVDALGLVGNRLDRVRKVTIVQVEGAPAQATKIGEFAYVVDMVPSAGGRGGQGRDRRGGRGGKQGGRGGKPGGRGGPGGGRGGKPGAVGKKPEVEDLSGPFSMDAAAADRKEAERNERKRGGPGGRGGRPGGRGGRPGGGRGGSGGRGGPGGSRA